MIYIENMSHDPWFNLALEEYFLHMNIEEDIISLWQNDRSVIIGRHQNTLEQINQKYTTDNDIKIARRMTGGGAVYHDLGNLNYTFITTVKDRENLDFRRFAQPVVDAVKLLGAELEITGRNDLTLNGRKVSGTAQAGIGNRILFHGTILFDVNERDMAEALQVDTKKLQAKGVKSVRNRVVNLKPHLASGTDIAGIKKAKISVLSDRYDVRQYIPAGNDRLCINELMAKKYASDMWIYGESKEGNFHNKCRFDGGEVEVVMSLKEGRIEECNVYGDFLGIYGVEKIEEMLKGKLYKYETVKACLKKVRMADYFGNITAEELLTCMFRLI